MTEKPLALTGKQVIGALGNGGSQAFASVEWAPASGPVRQWDEECETMGALTEVLDEAGSVQTGGEWLPREEVRGRGGIRGAGSVICVTHPLLNGNSILPSGVRLSTPTLHNAMTSPGTALTSRKLCAGVILGASGPTAGPNRAAVSATRSASGDDHTRANEP